MATRAHVIEQLQENFQSIRRKLLSKGMMAAHKKLCRITPSQWGVLRVIDQGGHVSIKDIAARLEISSSAATQLADALADNGHLKRVDNPDDRRSQYLELSPAAKKQMKLLRKLFLERMSDVFSVLSDKELAQYLRLSTKVASQPR